MRTLADSLRWLDTGTAFVLEQVESADLAQPSRLPGWCNRHIVAHLARNAEAVGRLLHWARTGVETPMYPSPDARAAEIERDAERNAEAQRADAQATAAAFAAAVDQTPDSAWDALVRSARGRLIPASEIPWLRVREVWLHGVDLGAPMSALPADVVDALCTDVADAMNLKDTCPGLRLESVEREWVIGDGAQTVSGPAPDLLGWLIGRGSGSGLSSDQPLPVVPAWL